MTQKTDQAPAKPEQAREKFEIDIEGTVHPWSEETISVPQLRALGGFAPTDELLEVALKDSTERTLREDEIVHLKPGHGFAKKIRYKRG